MCDSQPSTKQNATKLEATGSWDLDGAPSETTGPSSKEESEAKLSVVNEFPGFATAPFDPRFPNTNQTKHCYVNFLDHKRCIKLRGEDYAPCEYFRKVYQVMCPSSWIEKWETQIEEGRFPGKI